MASEGPRGTGAAARSAALSAPLALLAGAAALCSWARREAFLAHRGGPAPHAAALRTSAAGVRREWSSDPASGSAAQARAGAGTAAAAAVALGASTALLRAVRRGASCSLAARPGRRQGRRGSARAAVEEGPYPELCVFDLDACLWDKEMFEMQAVPKASDKVVGDLNGRGEGVVGVMSGRDKISLHAGSLVALQEHADGKYPGMRIAVASSADTPFAERVGRASLALLEVLPGLTVWDMLLRDWDGDDVNQIGRQPPLSSNKSLTHFPRLRAATGVCFDKMLFFDDCLWGDHCGMVAENCVEANGRSPVTVRTPKGLGEAQWRLGLSQYAKAQAD